MKKIIIAALAVIFTLGANAQNATNSPYSQYGYGILADQSNGAGKGMNGLSLGWREHNQVNFKNPASYSAIDSLSFIFDAGISGQLTNFNDNGRRLNAKNSSFDYVIAGFRAFRHVGVSFGMVPYSNIGYSYYNKESLNASNNSSSSDVTWTNTYVGNGGVHQVFLGLGVEPLKGLSVGANISYFWGDYSKSVVNSYSDAYVNTLSKYYTADVRSYKLDLGLQYNLKLSKTESVTLGVVFSNGHSVKADPDCKVISTNSQTAVADTAMYKANGQLMLPMTYGGGIVWNHSNRIRVGADYEYAKWSSVDYPMYQVNNSIPSYNLVSGQFIDSHKFTLGGDFCANEMSRNYLKRVHFRAGMSYSTPYLKINGVDGPREIGASIGIGLPLQNRWNNRSLLNISAQWSNLSADNLIKENTFRINIGFTFNQQWFAKWKVE